MRIELDDLSRPAVQALLEEHIGEMRRISPPESCHVLDLAGLRHASITFWSVWDGDLLLGIGALKELDATHGEIKSMRTPATARRRGVGKAILAHIIAVAESRDYRRLSLETGAQPEFRPAMSLYESFGFTFCPPFGSYKVDPLSVFMTKRLAP